MKDQAKSLAATLVAALKKKGVSLSKGAALDVTSELLGVKDWNALSAVVSQRRNSGQLQNGIKTLLDAMAALAEEAGDAAEWNEGGFAREACKAARQALSSSTSPEVTPPALLGFLQELAQTPLDGEFCLDARNGVQYWDELAGTYARLEYLVQQGRDILEPSRRLAYSSITAKCRDAGVRAAHLDEAVQELADSYASDVANSLLSGSDQDDAYSAWESRASDVNNGGIGAQIQFLIDGYGAVKANAVVDEVIKEVLKAH
jgi:hypothetical protein